MAQAYVLEENHRKCDCGYTARKKDAFWIDTYACWHIICYNCGAEWVQ